MISSHRCRSALVRPLHIVLVWCDTDETHCQQGVYSLEASARLLPESDRSLRCGHVGEAEAVRIYRRACGEVIDDRAAIDAVRRLLAASAFVM